MCVSSLKFSFSNEFFPLPFDASGVVEKKSRGNTQSDSNLPTLYILTFFDECCSVLCWSPRASSSSSYPCAQSDSLSSSSSSRVTNNELCLRLTTLDRRITLKFSHFCCCFFSLGFTPSFFSFVSLMSRVQTAAASNIKTRHKNSSVLLSLRKVNYYL